MLNWLKNLFAKKELNEKEQIESELKKKLKAVNLIYVKRKVDNYPDNLPMNVCDFVRKDKTLKNNLSIKDIWSIPLTYVTDSFSVNGIPDYWQLPEETEVIKKGDCEDHGSYRHTLANNAGFQNIFSCLGYYNGQGHFFNVMVDLKILKEVGFMESLILLEPTSNQYNPQPILNLKEYQVVYIFNENNCFFVDGTATQIHKDFNLKVRKNG